MLHLTTHQRIKHQLLTLLVSHKYTLYVHLYRYLLLAAVNL